MPYKDPRKKRGANQKWRRKAINEGYGQWLYARRKLRFDDAERFRSALELIAANKVPTTYGGGLHAVRALSHAVLEESRLAEEALGEFKPDMRRKPRRESVDDAVVRVAAKKKG